jgi:catecholate siderophore receptor
MRSSAALFRNFLLAFFLLGTGSAIFSADDNTAKVTIHGSIFDQSHAAIAGASVSAVPTGRAGNTSTTSDQNGEFSLTLEPGDYDLVIKAEGFSSLSKRIAVKPFDTTALDIELQIATNMATVTVTDSGEYQSEMITSGTKTSTALRDIPQSITVVGKQQIEDQQLTSIGDVVRYLPGVTAHQGENNRDQIIIRGQSSSADFFVNGVRDDVQYYRDLYNLDRIETLRGPNALVFGRGGGGGVINRVTKEAGFAPSRELTLQGSSFGGARVTGDFNQPIDDKFAFRANGIAEYSNSFRKNVNLRRYGFSPTLTFNPDYKTHFTLAYEFFRDRRVADRGITSFQNRPADVPISTYYGNPDDSHVRANVNLVTGTFERQYGNLNIRNRTMYGDYDRFYQNYVPGKASDDKTLVALSAYNNATRRRNLFNQTDLTYSVSTGALKHTILGGFELGRQHTNNFRNTGYFNNTSTSLLVPFDDPQTTVPVTFRQSATDADNRLHVNLAAAYVQDQVEITRYLQIVGGARFDYFDLNYHNNRNGDDIRRIDRLVSPRFGVVVKPITTLSLYGSYSVSFLPSSGDQFSSLTNVTQQVKPEKFENIEAGVKWDIRHNLSLTSAVYRLNRTNTRATDPNDSTRIIQTGSQRTNGFEIGLNGNITRSWTVVGGYAYQDAFITSATTTAAAGKQVAQVPHHSFSVWNKYQFLPKLSAGLGIINRSDMFAAIDNTVILPRYTRVDAAVFYTFNEHWRLQGNIENLFNTRYYLNADNNTNISPGAPIGAKIGLVARF